MKLKLTSTLLIFALLATTTSAASITPEKFRVTEYMNNYNLDNQNNSLQLACEIGQYVSTQYGWNCDIRQLNFTSHAPVYINVFYPAADNKKGYEAYYGWFGPQRKEVKDFYKKDEISNNNVMYYRDWGSDKNNWCGIQGVKSYGIVKSYWGDVAEDTDPVVIPEENNTTAPEDAYNNTSTGINNDIDNSNNVFGSFNNTSVANNSGNANNSAIDSKNTVNNQGWIGNVTQYFMDFSNTDWSNVTFNFWGN